MAINSGGFALQGLRLPVPITANPLTFNYQPGQSLAPQEDPNALARGMQTGQQMIAPLAQAIQKVENALNPVTKARIKADLAKAQEEEEQAKLGANFYKQFNDASTPSPTADINSSNMAQQDSLAGIDPLPIQGSMIAPQTRIAPMTPFSGGVQKTLNPYEVPHSSDAKWINNGWWVVRGGKPAIDPEWQKNKEEINKRMIDVNYPKDRSEVMTSTDSMQQAPIEEAQAFGVPATAPNPYRKMTNKTAESLRENFEKELDKKVKEDSADIDEATKSLNNVKRFMELQQENVTGGLEGMAKTAFGIRRVVDAGYKEMDTLANKLRLGEMKFMKGAISDKEQQFLSNSTLNVGNKAETNQNIANMITAALQRSLEKKQFEQAYANVHGTLRGADKAWGEYVNTVPLIDLKTGKINDKYMKWDDYFRAQNAGESVNPNSVQASGNEVTSKSDYDKIQPGEVFYSNGQPFRKPK